MLMPFIEQANVFQLWDTTLNGAYYKTTDEARQAQISTYLCPTRRRPPQLGEALFRFGGGGPGASGDYAVCFGPNPPSAAPNSTFGAFMYANNNGGVVTFDSTGHTFDWRNPTSFVDIRDGTSNTIFIGEKHVRQDELRKQAGGDASVYCDDAYTYHGRIAGPGYPLARSPIDDVGGNRYWQFGSYHPGICQFAMGDGRVISISSTIDTDVLLRLAHRSDGEPVTLP